MDGNSQTPQQQKLKELQKILPEVFSKGKVDWEKLKATLSENISFNNENALDKLFEGNDRLKTNTALQIKDAAIAFKTI